MHVSTSAGGCPWYVELESSCYFEVKCKTFDDFQKKLVHYSFCIDAPYIYSLIHIPKAKLRLCFVLRNYR